MLTCLVSYSIQYTVDAPLVKNTDTLTGSCNRTSCVCTAQTDWDYVAIAKSTLASRL